MAVYTLTHKDGSTTTLAAPNEKLAKDKAAKPVASVKKLKA